MSVSQTARHALAAACARALLCGAAMVGVLSCGGGGGDDPGGGPERPEGVYSGFEPKIPGLTLEQALNWEYQSAGGDGGGVGAGADGDGGVGAGGDFGQFRNARVVVRYPDGTLVGGGEAITDANTGMVTIVPRKGYRGPLHLELRGGNGATYYEEGKDTFVEFPAGQVIRAIVPAIDRNIGITPFSEAAYRLLTEGSTTERAANPAQPTAEEIRAANARVLGILNQQFPQALRVDDITRLPFIKSPTIGANSIGIDARGRYGLVNGAFSKQAAMFNPGRTQPTLDAVSHLGADLLDGVLDGMNGSQPAAAANVRTYDAHTLTGELSSALAEQSYRFGNDESKLALPKVLNFANSRYEGYLFDASLTAAGQAFDTVVGWVGDNSRGRTIGQAFNKLPDEARVYSVVGNFGHGSLFFRANTGNSSPKTYVVGDNINGELGLGTTASTGGQAVEIQLPGVATHVAGGFGHTLARMADGAVYAWGNNSSGQLGLGHTTSATTPQRVTLPRGALAVAATSTASYALLDDGSVYAWGAGAGFGLLGDGNKNSARNAPAPITALSGIVQISARDNDVVVLRRDGAVLHWGSFPSDPVAFTPGDVAAPYAGGSPLPTPVAGLPPGVAVRKVLTEQGLFAALLADGSVYQWGVYFDITADALLRDLQATRVLSLPPLRDMMPGGFIGYGVRPFDRLTAMGIDYRGGMWKVRGRVAEEFDPANPTQQRRPRGQAPRPDCASCHTALNDWPLTPQPPTTTDVCQPPTSIHGGGDNGPSLIHAETVCEKCHNPARQPPAPLFPNGWLTCVKGTNLPPRSNPVPPPVVTNACTIPTAHTFTPPGTVCASCHNSVIARPLNDPALNCAQPGALPSIRTTVSITTALNDANSTIAAGASTTDTTPTLQGTLSAALQSGQALRVLRNGSAIGAATVSGTNWSFTEPGAPNGTHGYAARVEAGSAFGPTSSAYRITVDTAAPTQTANVTQISDDISGNLADGASTSDTTPGVAGTLSAALGANESLQVLRNAAVVATLAPAGTSWSFAEPNALAAGTYRYTARVADAAGNLSSAAGSARSVTVNTSFPLAGAATTLSTINGVAPTGGAVPANNVATPVLAGTIQRALNTSPAEVVRVYRSSGGNSAPVGTASVSGTSWSFTSAALTDGTYAFLARIERSSDASMFGQPSASVNDPIDTVRPGQGVRITATSSVEPFQFYAGNDATPALTVTLTQPLGAGETVVLMRAIGTAAAQTIKTFDASEARCTVQTPCFEFTDSTGLNIPVPPAAPNTSLPGTSYAYSGRVRDPAGNDGDPVSVTVQLGHLLCDQARANTATNGNHGVIAAGAPNAIVSCSGCHGTSPATPGTEPTPAGRHVAVPARAPTYWCRRPGATPN
jgi:hypothetical protein